MLALPVFLRIVPLGQLSRSHRVLLPKSLMCTHQSIGGLARPCYPRHTRCRSIVPFPQTSVSSCCFPLACKRHGVTMGYHTLDPDGRWSVSLGYGPVELLGVPVSADARGL